MQTQDTTEVVKEEIGNTLEIVFSKFESWYHSFVEHIPNIISSALLLILFWLLARLIRKLFFKVIVKASADPSVRDILAQIVYYSVWALGFFLLFLKSYNSKKQ